MSKDSLVGINFKKPIPNEMTLMQAVELGYKYESKGNNRVRVYEVDGGIDEVLKLRLNPVAGQDKWEVFVKFEVGKLRVKKEIVFGYVYAKDLKSFGVESPRELDLSKELNKLKQN
ncbi:hypothetical protein KKG08_02185 [Patescibacteria group bacterium]|nr:hypothetical protein [Patescibacteria group bacterium]